jgi:hypothetical protein
MRFVPWASCLISLSLLACGRGPALQVLGESTRLERSEPSPKRSAFFDGKKVSLRAARGETLGISVRIGDGRSRRVRLELPSTAAAVTAFSVGSLEVKEASSDMYGPSKGTGVYPDVLTPREGAVEASDLVYFDVAVGSATPPNRYRGVLSVNDERFPVELEVSKARIETERDPLVWVFYLPREIARAHGLPDGDQPELIAREAEYHRLFRAHGTFLAADLLPERFPARKHFVTGVKYWPVAIDASSDESIDRDVKRWLELFRGSSVTPFAIPVDEPHSTEQKQRARHIAETVGKAGGGRPRFLRAVTDVAEPIYRDSMDLFFSPKNLPNAKRERAARGELFFTYNGRPPEAGSMILDTDGVALRTWGWIAERYGIELWYAWEGLYFTDRYNKGGPTDVMRDPLTFDERSRGGSDFGNGDGLLVYPGPLPSLRLKSLRRGLQDRLLIRQLASCGAAGAAHARAIVERAVPRALGEAGGKPSWSLEEPTWERARRELLDGIEATCQ